MTLHSLPLLSPSPPMSSSLLRRTLTLTPSPLHLHFRLRRLSVAASVRHDTATWTQAPLSSIRPASDDQTLFHLSVDVSDYPDLSSSHAVPGQYLQVRIPKAAEVKPAFLAIASPPRAAAETGVFEFLVKTVKGTTAEVLCGMGKGEVVELSAVMGKGFRIEGFEPVGEAETVLIFATGSGISPIRSLIESGFNAKDRSDVRLYYGARNLQRMAYQDRFKEWEASGVRIVPVLSQPDNDWEGERGYVQAAFARMKQILNPSSTGAVLCGHKQMAEAVTSTLIAEGVSNEKILMNF